MKKDELLEIIAVLTAKNTALEKEVERLCKQTDRLWEDLKEYEKDQDEYEDDSDYYPPNPSFVPGDDDPAYPYNEPDGISKDIAVMQIEIRDLNHKVEKLEKRMTASEGLEELRNEATNLEFSELKSEIRELNRWAVTPTELADKVDELDGYYKMCLKVLIDDDKQFNLE
jgi:uncharacterized coiled-coil DUF342 family protein|tara:strand:- start:323 stop:832 length:510 start_codon:yes stop_codon:yes gene_type:complete